MNVGDLVLVLNSNKKRGRIVDKSFHLMMVEYIDEENKSIHPVIVWTHQANLKLIEE